MAPLLKRKCLPGKGFTLWEGNAFREKAPPLQEPMPSEKRLHPCRSQCLQRKGSTLEEPMPSEKRLYPWGTNTFREMAHFRGGNAFREKSAAVSLASWVVVISLRARPLPNMLIFLPKILCSNSHTFTYFSLTLYRLCSKSFSLFSIQNTLKYTQIHSNILKYTQIHYVH